MNSSSHEYNCLTDVQAGLRLAIIMKENRSQLPLVV
jgi:hypothetical protein